MTDKPLHIFDEIKSLGEWPDDNFDEYRRCYTQAIAVCFGIPLTSLYSQAELTRAVMKMAGIKDETHKEV